MKREQALQVLAASKPDLMSRYGVRRLALFGSTARDGAHAGSDVDVPVDVRQRFPEIPWRRVIATRNRLIHGYLGIDDDILWSIVQADMPPLLAALRALRSAG